MTDITSLVSARITNLIAGDDRAWAATPPPDMSPSS